MLFLAFNIAGLALISGLGFIIITLYNHLEAAQQEVEKAYGSIDLLLAQRRAELPKLAELCRGNKEFEEIHVQLAALRPRCEGGRLASRLEAENQFLALFALALVRAEGHPTLKSPERFKHLQARVTDLEGRIAARRTYFNDAASAYNTWIAQLPQALLARLSGHKPLSLLNLP